MTRIDTYKTNNPRDMARLNRDYKETVTEVLLKHHKEQFVEEQGDLGDYPENFYEGDEE